MDSLTHLTLGVCTGELLLGKKLGKKAMLWGAIAANIPDVDTVTGFFVTGDKGLLLHRGITHSVFFALITGLLLAYLAKKLHTKITFLVFAAFFWFQLLLHDLLDTCTTYGTGLLEPFNHSRFSVNLLYVADPLFTIGLLVAAVYLLFAKTYRIKWAAAGVILSGFYLCVACVSKIYIGQQVKSTLTTPAPFTSLLWYCVDKTEGGYYTCYRSVFDKQQANYTYHAQNNALLQQPEPYLKAFAYGYYTISRSNDKLYFNIVRFGEVQGWANKNAPFALSYPLASTGDENMIIQKGRLSGWNKHTFMQYLERIMGK